MKNSTEKDSGLVTNKPNDIHLARRVISYYGLIKHTDYVNADKIYQIKQKANLARKAVSNESKIQRTTA